MHGPSPTFGTSLLPAIYFCHQSIKVTPFCEIVPVGSVRAVDPIIRAKAVADTDGDSLFA
jgi:hypothetical protein